MDSELRVARAFQSRRKRSWVSRALNGVLRKVPVLAFITKYALLLLGFYALSLLPAWDPALRTWMRWNAHGAAAVLSWLGQPCQATEATLWSSAYGIALEPGCSAFNVIGFFAVTVLAFPAKAGRKLLGLVLGTAALLILNFLRVLTLYWTGTHFPGAFEWVHFELWPSILVLVTLGLCAAWLHHLYPKAHVPVPA